MSCEKQEKFDLGEVFGSKVFNDKAMKKRLPESTYNVLKKTIKEGLPLDPSIADVVANAMKDWAVENGATHFTHWFQPMTGITAEKQDAFLSPKKGGKIVPEFSGKNLIKGEPDASSFPSGGLRATFEARGYTAWDCTSPAFLREDEGGVTLCIPTAFFSYTGEALDKKIPLLRSMQAVSKQSMRILKLFGNTTSKKVVPNVGAEQEYFLVDKVDYSKRKDLIYTGRTLFGAKPPKGQELEDHYFGSIKERVGSFMKELDYELWKLGVPSKTRHNEVAPAQFEIAPIFTDPNIASDQNQIIMNTLKKVAGRHGFVCLLHEKPYEGINGSGKHNNWSLSTDDGQNLLDPGKTPRENAQFLTFLCAVIKSIDENAGLLRASVSNTGNDHRLGANEAPPAIISIFLGDNLTSILKEIENGETGNDKKREMLKVGVSTLPPLPKDSSDRNRTSPFAFTGNKFEFRMVPSSASISDPNVVLNTIVAESLKDIADKLETAEDFNGTLQEILKDIIKKHKRVIFNGNGYSDEWIKEAEKRGLPNITNTVDAIPQIIEDRIVKMFEAHKVLSKAELYSRYEIMLEAYTKEIGIEARTMIDMSKKEIVPSVIKYIKLLSDTATSLKGLNVEASPELDILKHESELLSEFKSKTETLENALKEAEEGDGDIYHEACLYRDKVYAGMQSLRTSGDELEVLTDENFWPFPTYGKLLFFM